MHCKYCGFANGEDDHRCLRCGRRTGYAIAAPASYSSGANALAPSFDLNDTQEIAAESAQLRTAASQPALFTAPAVPATKVIPFDQIPRPGTGRLNVPQPAAPVTRTPPSNRTPATKSVHLAEQGSLDFVPVAPSAHRILKTDVPAQIYCEQPVATPTHRFIAGSMDTAMILLGFGMFVVAAQFAGGNFGTGKLFWIALGAAFALISMFYSLIWAIAGRETAGMHWTDLQLITFDGFPVDGRTRASRLASAWLSFGSGGLGLLWAIAYEENLTWHDHISKTFPTVKEAPRTFVRQRRK
jgi:hypothetical protein